MSPSTHSKGAWQVVLAYGLWGFFPIYWKALVGLSPLQLICHRIVWSFAVLAVVVLASGERQALWRSIGSRRVLTVYSVAALSIALNWLVFVWAVGVNQIVQISLGYFINPLLNVVLGLILFRERLRRGQWASVALAAAGVLYLTVVLQSLPWIALTLAASFATYGLLKKVAPLKAVHGLTLETGVLFVPAAAYLVAEEIVGRGVFLHSGALRDLLMLGAGPTTTLPLLLFAAGMKRIPLSLAGMLQYINPTMQIAIGVFLYKEPFTHVQLIGFGLVWCALVLFAIEGYVANRRG